jgi:putative effector of murein hydrolase
MSALALAGIALTLGCYALARKLNVRFPLPITNPVVTSVPLIIGVLLVCGIDYPGYLSGAGSISELLAPATVALALPLYRHRAVLGRYAASAIAGLCAGALSAMIAALLLAKWLSLGAAVYPALGVKSATAPIAVQLGPLVAAEPGLCAVLAIATGMTGAVLGPPVLNALAIHDPVARGLAYGTISHGIGTAQAAAEGELQGAVSGVAMGCAAVIVSLLAPHLLPWFV